MGGGGGGARVCVWAVPTERSLPRRCDVRESMGFAARIAARQIACGARPPPPVPNRLHRNLDAIHRPAEPNETGYIVCQQVSRNAPELR